MQALASPLMLPISLLQLLSIITLLAAMQAMAMKLCWIAIAALLTSSSSVQGEAGAVLLSSGELRVIFCRLPCLHSLLQAGAVCWLTTQLVSCAGYRRALLFGLGDVTKAVTDTGSNAVREVAQVRTTVASAGTNAVQSAPTWCAS